MATLKIAKSLAALGIAKETAIGRSVIKFAGTDLGEPLGKATNLKLKKRSFTCKVKYSKKGWEALKKLCARVHKLALSEPIPGVKKGETITIHTSGAFGNEKITGILYHVRKPYRDHEDRVYYIREEFGNLPKKRSRSPKR